MSWMGTDSQCCQILAPTDLPPTTLGRSITHPDRSPLPSLEKPAVKRQKPYEDPTTFTAGSQQKPVILDDDEECFNELDHQIRDDIDACEQNDFWSNKTKGGDATDDEGMQTDESRCKLKMNLRVLQ